MKITTITKSVLSHAAQAAIVLALLAVSGACVYVARGQAMSSPNYMMQSQSLNFGGGAASSTSYQSQSTLGEVATGISSSTNYTMSAGFQQMQAVALIVSPASNVTMSPSIGGVSGGTSNGATSFTVTTDDSAGYAAVIQASSSPAMQLTTGAYSFPDYVPAGGNPDFGFIAPAAASEFGFSPKGTDIVQRYEDNGSACNSGTGQTAGACWDGLSTSPITIDSRTSSNQPSGTVTTVNFRAASGSSHIQVDGTYVATTTVTITAL